ncbi:MAG: hypothetical protein JXA89_19320 [Anaerolineae bacterium]|nr:hypothetical protein [Anaerolineae bacterium]
MELQVWKDRWQTLDNQIERLSKRLEHTTFPRQPTLLSLTKRLRVFAAGQFTFLYNGFLNGTLSKCSQYPQEYALHGIISQITHDIHALQRAVWQREMTSEQLEKIRWKTYEVQVKTAYVVSTTQDANVRQLADDLNNVASQVLQMQDPEGLKSKTQEMHNLALHAQSIAAGISEPGTKAVLEEALAASKSAKAAAELAVESARAQKALDIADRLAWAALQPAISAGLVDKDTTVLVYFTKLNSIRIIPYAPVALIGIPLTCINSPQDYLAIPHEIGHYVFRRGIHGETDIHKEIDTETDCAPWREETFADVYGCIVAGPVAALSFQAIQMERKPKSFITDDGEHAMPMIRPYVYTQTLYKTGFPEWGKRLEDLWHLRKNVREDDLGRSDTERGTLDLGSENKLQTLHLISLIDKAVKPPMDRVIDYTIKLFSQDDILIHTTQDWKTIIGQDFQRTQDPADLAYGSVEREPKAGPLHRFLDALWRVFGRESRNPDVQTRLDDSPPPTSTYASADLRHRLEMAETALFGQFAAYFEPGTPSDPSAWRAPDDLLQIEDRVPKQECIRTFVETQSTYINNCGTLDISGKEPWPQPFFQVGEDSEPNSTGMDEIPAWVHIAIADGWNTFSNGVWTDHP